MSATSNGAEVVGRPVEPRQPSGIYVLCCIVRPRRVGRREREREKGEESEKEKDLARHAQTRTRECLLGD